MQPRLFPGVTVILVFYKQNTNCGQTFAAHFSHVLGAGSEGAVVDVIKVC